jgi:lipid-binding SYLF domain-containing protein
MIAKSAGYAVFNNMGANVLLLSTVNAKSKKETFMKMISPGAGLGLGVKDQRVIFVFENNESFAHFPHSGRAGSGQADAAAKAGKAGGAYAGAAEIEPGMWMYQITKIGLALQLTLQGTKYYKDQALNESQACPRLQAGAMVSSVTTHDHCAIPAAYYSYAS